MRHKKQTGGSGQYAHIVGRMDVLPADAEDTFVFEEEVVGGRIPKQYIPAVEKGFRKNLAKGPLAGYPVVGLKVMLDGRLLPRGRQFRPGLPDLRPDHDAGELLPHPARAPGAGDEDRDRVSQFRSRARWWAI